MGLKCGEHKKIYDHLVGSIYYNSAPDIHVLPQSRFSIHPPRPSNLYFMYKVPYLIPGLCFLFPGRDSQSRKLTPTALRRLRQSRNILPQRSRYFLNDYSSLTSGATSRRRANVSACCSNASLRDWMLSPGERH